MTQNRKNTAVPKCDFAREQYMKLLLPGTLTYVVFIIQQLSDVVICGQFLGSEALAGISLIAPLVTAGGFVSGLLPKGTCIQYNFASGRFDRKEMSRIFSSSLLACVLITALEILILNLSFESFLSLYSPSASVDFHAREYFRWYRWAIALLPIFELMDNLVYNDGDVLISNICHIVVVGGNILGSILLAPLYGAGGIAMASMISYILGSVTLFLHLLRKTNTLHFSPYFSFEQTLQKIRLSFPHALAYLTKSIMIAGLNAIVIRRYGEAQVVVLSTVMMLFNLESVFCGTSEAATPFIGIYLGEDNVTGIRRLMRIATRTVVLEALIFTAVSFLFAPLYPAALGIREAETFQLSVHAIRLVCFGAVFDALLTLYHAYYMTMYHPGISMAIGSLSQLLFVFLPTVLLAGTFGLDSLWISLLCSAALTFLVISAYICLRYGKDAYPLLLGEKEEVGIFNVRLEPSGIAALCDEVDASLADLDSAVRNRIRLVIEETGNMVYEKNGRQPLSAEYDIWKRKNARIILRFGGIPYDFTEDADPGSMREYLFQCLQTEKIRSRYLMSQAQNRIQVDFPPERGETPEG